MQGVCMLQGVLYSHEGFFICLGNGCSCDQLRLFHATVSRCVVFKFLPFGGFLSWPFIFLWAFSCKMTGLMAMVTPILVLTYCFSRYLGSFGSGPFVELSSRGPASPREASSVTLELAFRLIPVVIPVSSKPSSSLPGEFPSASPARAGDIWFVGLPGGFALYVHLVEGVSESLDPI